MKHMMSARTTDGRYMVVECTCGTWRDAGEIDTVDHSWQAHRDLQMALEMSKTMASS